MWEVRDAEEGEVHPSVRERERGGVGYGCGASRAKPPETG